MLKGTLRQEGRDEPATSERVLAALAGTGFFWLDLDDIAGDGTVSELLGVHFGFHPLAVEAAERFAQRPRIDDYDDFIFLVARGADPDKKGTAEVHCFWTDRYVVTVHRGECPAIAHVHERLERHPATQVSSPQIIVVYLVIGALVDTLLPLPLGVRRPHRHAGGRHPQDADRGTAGRALRHEAQADGDAARSSRPSGT